jgi:magnesium-transporting ATPase (P-type)
MAVRDRHGFVRPLYRQATTACLAAIVLLQIVNVFLCRSAVRSAFTTGLGGNSLILWGCCWRWA